jgi:hypothetical protein
MFTWESLQAVIQRYLQLSAKHWSRGFHCRYSIRKVSQVYPMDSKRKGNSLGSDSRGKDLRQQKTRHWTCSQRERQHISAPDNHPNSSGYFLTPSCQPYNVIFFSDSHRSWILICGMHIHVQAGCQRHKGCSPARGPSGLYKKEKGMIMSRTYETVPRTARVPE